MPAQQPGVPPARAVPAGITRCRHSSLPANVACRQDDLPTEPAEGNKPTKPAEKNTPASPADHRRQSRASTHNARRVGTTQQPKALRTVHKHAPCVANPCKSSVKIQRIDRYFRRKYLTIFFQKKTKYFSLGAKTASMQTYSSVLFQGTASVASVAFTSDPDICRDGRGDGGVVVDDETDKYSGIDGEAAMQADLRALVRRCQTLFCHECLKLQTETIASNYCSSCGAMCLVPHLLFPSLSDFCLASFAVCCMRCETQRDLMALCLHSVPTGSYRETRPVVAAEEENDYSTRRA